MKECSSGPLSGALKPKYRRLSVSFGENYVPENGIDIFIDLNTLIQGMSSWRKWLNSLPFSSNAEQDICSTVLTTLKHWKDYTNRWNDVRIFMMYNDFNTEEVAEKSQLKAYLAQYSNKYKNEKYTQLVYYWNESMKILEPLFDFLPNSYLIKCNKFDSFILPEIIDDYDKNKRDRFIISGSPTLMAYNFRPRTKAMFTKLNGSSSGAVNVHIDDLTMIVQSFTNIHDEIMNIFTSNRVLFTLLNTIVGDKDRSVIGLTQFGITVFATDILRCIEKGEIPSDPKSIESVLPVINSSYHDYIKKNFPLMDVQLHAQMIKPSIIEQTRARLVDKSDIDSLMKFTINGLNLMELL